MTASTNLVHIVSTTQPTGLNLGDEWYNPTTNTLYKNLLVNGTTTLVNQLPASANSTSNISMPTGTGAAAVQGLSTNIASGNVTPSTSGTSIDFTGIPSWVKRITIVFNGVSENSASQNLIIQIGNGNIVTTGYASSSAYAGSGSTGATSTAGLIVANTVNSANILSGTITLTALGQNIWVSSGTISITNGAFVFLAGGNSPTLTSALDRIRITTEGGSATFTAGRIGILYE